MACQMMCGQTVTSSEILFENCQDFFSPKCHEDSMNPPDSPDPVDFVAYDDIADIKVQFYTMYFRCRGYFIPEHDDLRKIWQILQSTLKDALATPALAWGDKVKSDVFGHDSADGTNIYYTYYLCIHRPDKFNKGDLSQSLVYLKKNISSTYEQYNGPFVFKFAVEECGSIQVNKKGSSWRKALPNHCKKQQNQARPAGTHECFTQLGC
jgi:hypothetical protein